MEWRIKPVDSSGCLLHNLIAIVLRVEYNRVSLDTIPTLTSGSILNQIYPSFAIRNRLMLMTVPFGYLYVLAIVQILQNIQFVVEVVEYDYSRMVFDNLHDSYLSRVVRINHFA